MLEPENMPGARLSEETWGQATRLYHQLKPLSAAEQAARLEAMRASGEEDLYILSLVASYLEQLPEPDRLLTGERIGNFLLKERIGMGGMGEVYVAEQMLAGVPRDIAVKILRPTFAHAEALQERLTRISSEIFHLERLRDVVKLRASIVAIHDADFYLDPRTQQQFVYMVMELVQQGKPITTYANEHDLRIEQRLRLFEIVCKTVGEVHQQGIFHLDLKPPNILVNYKGDPFVIDFGIARAYEELQPGGYQARLGTLAYMSPEQLFDIGPISAASDVYALGIILFELLAREHPYGRSLDLSYDALHAIVLESSPRLLSQAQRDFIGSDLEPIVAEALAPHPQQRPSALRLAERLEFYRQRYRDRNAIEKEHGTSRSSLNHRGHASVEEEEVMDSRPNMLEEDEVMCPYRGLEAFQAEHAPFFFGREELTEELLERLSPLPGSVEAKRFLAIIGPSGYGKSSLAQAGLVAQLQQGQLEGSAEWPVLTCKPGESPLESLALTLVAAPALQPGLAAVIQATGGMVEQVIAALKTEIRTLHRIIQVTLQNTPGSRRVVVVVDQFEEIFTLCTNEEDRAAFIKNLLQAAITMGGRTIIVLTMRDDFYGACARYPDLAIALSHGQEVLVRRMTHAELHRAVEEPARQKRYTFDRRLVEELVDEVIDEPGSLPALQDVLHALWERRDLHHRLLTRAAYHDIGGMKGALQQRAETVYTQFTAEEQEDCKRIFRRLVQPSLQEDIPRGDNPKDTKRRVAQRELVPVRGETARVDRVVQRLVQERLITASEGDRRSDDRMLELAHESLIHYWERLRAWLAENHEARQVHRHLRETAEAWQQRGRDVSLLYRGRALAQARTCAQQDVIDVNALEQEFLQASRAEQVREEAVQQAQRDRDQQMQQWVQSLVLLITVPLCVGVIGAVVREVFFQLLGSFLQPLPLLQERLSSEVWNGFLGSFIGAFYLTLAFETVPARAPRSRLLRYLATSATGFAWGATLLFAMEAAYGLEGLRKIGWHDSNIKYGFLVTGTFWSCGLALGSFVGDLITQGKQHATLRSRLLWQVVMTLLFSFLSPLALPYVLKNIAANELFARAWGEAVGQGLSVCTALGFYYLLKYAWLDKLWASKHGEDVVTVQERFR